MNSAQVHRFGDSVAAYIGTGPTVYMTAREARAMARALVKAARSVEREGFAQSSGTTTQLALSDWQRSGGVIPRLERDAEGRAIRSKGAGV